MERPAPGLAAIALTVAGLLFARPACGDHRWLSRGPALAVALGCAATAAIIPWPERLGFLLVAACGVLLIVPGIVDRVRQKLWQSVAGLGAILVLLAVAAHAYRLVEAAVHELPGLARPLAALFAIVGIRAEAEPPWIHLPAYGTVMTFDVSVEKIVGYGLALYGTASLATLFVLRGRRAWPRGLLVLLGSAMAFAVVRFLVLGLVLTDTLDPSIAWRRDWMFAMLLPFVGLLAALRPLRGSAEVADVPITPRQFRARRVGALLVVAITFGALTAATFGFFDPGTPKPGRILIDERHSNWEWTSIALNKEAYGVQTVYNYSEFVRYLGHFYEISPNLEPFSDSLLAAVDVVILKTPTRPYEKPEIETLLRFVDRGGGLWLIGDHTNIFGMSTNLNQVAGRFGVRFNFDAVVDLVSLGRQLFRRPRLFAHPVVRHLPPLLLATSCSLSGPARGSPVMAGNSLLSDQLDYSVNSFFGNFLPDPDESFGCMLQSVALSHGRGRVLFFSDSTIFSNFFMFIRGKPELALSSVAWLMRENRWAWLRTVFMAGAALSLVAWILLGAGLSRMVSLAAIAIAAPAFALTAGGLGVWVGSWSVRPAPRTPMKQIAFAREHCAFHIPEETNIPERLPQSYHTFYVWTQRVGFIPRTDSLWRCTEDAEAAVIVNPRGPFRASDLARLEAFVRGGGGLLLLDRPAVPQSTANDILARFGMSFEPAVIESTTARVVATGDTLVLWQVGRVAGGTPVVLLPDGTSVLSTATIGAGKVFAMCGADNFSDAALGITSEVPDAQELNLYRLEYQVLEALGAPGQASGQEKGAGGIPPPAPSSGSS